MFRRSDSHNSNPSVRSSRLFDDSKEETISRIEFPLKQEINVLNNKLEKVNHKYTQVAEDRKKYIEQITL